jgi:hypothetical protein
MLSTVRHSSLDSAALYSGNWSATRVRKTAELTPGLKETRNTHPVSDDDVIAILCMPSVSCFVLDSFCASCSGDIINPYLV